VHATLVIESRLVMLLDVDSRSTHETLCAKNHSILTRSYGNIIPSHRIADTSSG
jgi:hypothetical protein